jgi:hypothetical protein
MIKTSTLNIPLEYPSMHFLLKQILPVQNILRTESIARCSSIALWTKRPRNVGSFYFIDRHQTTSLRLSPREDVILSIPVLTAPTVQHKTHLPGSLKG